LIELLQERVAGCPIMGAATALTIGHLDRTQLY
jgi:hypothetical protein